jgi:integrase
MAAQADLKVLRWVTTYWHQEYGPLNPLPIIWKPKNNPPRQRWLTRSEAARLLKAAKPYLHLRRMILLGLYTGSRPGVLLHMRWDQVDLEYGVMYRLPLKILSDAKKRAPPVKIGRRMLGHLKRWKKLDGEIAYVCHFGGFTIGDPHTSWRKVVKAAGLPGVTRHTLRHTRATWLMQAGIDPWEAAGHLGMTVRTLESVYGHHSPDHQEKAANV